MGSRRKGLAIAAIGTSLVAFTALGSDSPEEKTIPEGSGSCCSGGTEGACCSDIGRQTALVTALLAQGKQGADESAAPKQQAKASSESLAKGVATRKALLDQMMSLMEDGVADCCINPGCAFCVLAADGCPCAGNLAKGGPVCPECWGGWQSGQGMLPGVKAEEVKILPKDQLKKVYGMKAEKLEQAGQD